jgi:hypothetical protein
MDHCDLHTFFHPDCHYCQKTRQAERDREAIDDSASSNLLTTIAAVEIAEEVLSSPAQDVPVVETSVPDGSGFSSDTDTGGSFSGGGAGGDY